MLTAKDALRAVSTVITAGCEPAGSGIDTAGKKFIPAGTDSPLALLPLLSGALQEGNVLIAAADPALCALCASLNNFPGGYKLAIWDGENLECTALLAELEKKSIRTESGMQFLPEATVHPALFAAEGRVLLRGGTTGGEKLLDANGAPWGILLPEWAGMKDLAGSLAECRAALTAGEQDAVYAQISAAEECNTPEHILIFRNGTELLALNLPDSPRMQSADMELFLCTGMMPGSEPDKLLAALCNLPDLRKASALAETYCTAVLA